MPFTISHIAAVLPLVGPGPRRVLVPSALVIGAMVPDLPLFIPSVVRARLPGLQYDNTHALLGLVTTDLAYGLAAFLVWTLLLRTPLADLAPDVLRRRLPDPVPNAVERLLLALPSLVVGAATHLFWDSFTHADRWGTRVIPALQAQTPVGLPAFKLAQYGSGVVGLTILTAWLVLWWRRTLPTAQPPAVTWRCTAWWATVVVTAVTALVAAGLALANGDGLERIAYVSVTRSLPVGAAAVLLIAVLWRVSARESRSTPRKRG